METKVRHIDVSVPADALGAADCNPNLVVPTPLPLGSDASPYEAATSIVAIRIPPSTRPDSILRLHVGDRQIDTKLPITLAAGDVANLVLFVDGSGRLVKKITEFFFFVPEGQDDEECSVALPDATSLRFSAPRGSSGEIVKFQLEECGWALKCICKAPEPQPTLETVADVKTPYAGVLDVVRASGLLQGLRADGTLHVSVPFCAGFAEHTALGNFLAEYCLPLARVNEVSVLATELFDRYSFNWANAERWYSKIHPRIRLRTRVCDLALDALPQAQLFIAIHPEVTRGGCWFQIMGSIIRSCNGLCVIACFWETEKETVLNMAEMYKAEGSSVEVHENPYYATHEIPFAAAMRYIILIASPS